MNVLAISVHPDDEAVGCAGTLLAHRDKGDSLSWLILTKAHEPQWSSELIARKAEEVDRVAAAYGVTDLVWTDFPSGALDVTPQSQLIGAVREAVVSVAPEVVYLVHSGDVHTDHAAAFRAVMSVLKPFHLSRLGVRRVLSYECLSSTEAAAPGGTPFVPTVFSDVTEQMERKLDVMRLYESEIHADPLPRGLGAIRALGRFRGSTIGVEYAEAFVLLRELI